VVVLTCNLALRKMRQKDSEFKTSLGYREKSVSKQLQKNVGKKQT
jgi:hypothetical protein